MGKSVTPTFRIEVKDNVSPHRWIPLTWRGRASARKLLDWVHNYNRSHRLSGCNFHITEAYRKSGNLKPDEIVFVTEARIIRQATGEIEHTYILHEDGTGSASTDAPDAPLKVKDVKKLLPEVPIEINGKTFTGQVKGRKEPFASVHVYGISVEFSWEAVTRAVNSGNPLLSGIQFSTLGTVVM